jgi:hypothetical protein
MTNCWCGATLCNLACNNLYCVTIADAVLTGFPVNAATGSLPFPSSVQVVMMWYWLFEIPMEKGLKPG